MYKECDLECAGNDGALDLFASCHLRVKLRILRSILSGVVLRLPAHSK